jgi:tripartite-type tricarboxylate transporter receptor subunit TctC
MKNLIKATSVLALLAATPAMAWEPAKPVEIVVAAGAGGASDQMARMMQAAIQKNNLMKQPVIVSLKGGASGAEALMYMKGSDGDPNKVLIAYSLIYMLPLSAKIPFNWRDLTPVSVIAMDQFVLWDNANGPKTVKDFIAAAKASSTPFKMGGTGSKREDHVLTVFMEKKTGAKFSYLPYKSGGEADPACRQPHRVQRQQSVGESGSLARRPGSRALRVRQGAHLLQDQGHRNAVVERHPDLQGRRPRHAVPDAARDVPSRQGDAGADRVLRRSVQEGDADPEYKEYMEKQALKPVYINGKDMLKFLEEDDALNKSLMTEAGFVAK